MLSVGFLFIFVAGISFLGFVINALFGRIKIASILPLMLIGLLVGPAFHLINAGPGSLVSELIPYIAAIAISFVVFDVGINIKTKHLGLVLGSATKFTLLTQVAIGLLLAIAAHYAFGWSPIIALIFGFAASGPSSIVVPSLLKYISGTSDNLKTTLAYECVLSDMIQLIVPLTLIGLITNPASATLGSAAAYAFTTIFGALLVGVVSAVFWLYIMNKFADYAKGYSWMLTITMIIATYGLSQLMGLSSTIAVFVFGLIFANIGFHSKKDDSEGEDRISMTISKYFAIKQDVTHTIAYQKEVVFFVSTFFFVYIGILFSFAAVSLYEVALAIAFVLLIIATRVVMLPNLRGILSNDAGVRKVERHLVYFNIPRELAVVIIATSLLGYGISVPGFTDVVFLLVLFTNVAFSMGVMYTYRSAPGAAGKDGQNVQTPKTQPKAKAK